MLCRRSSNSNLPITSSDVMLSVREPGLGRETRLCMCACAASSRELWFALALPLLLTSSVISLIRSTRGTGEPSCRYSPSRRLGPGLDCVRSRRRGLPSISSEATNVAFMRRNWSSTASSLVRSGPVVASPSPSALPESGLSGAYVRPAAGLDGRDGRPDESGTWLASAWSRRGSGFWER
jgi:hypothetical protein